MGQDTIFFQSEADQWFKRNGTHLDAEDLLRRDLILQLIDELHLRPGHCLEVGGANGYRLAAIHQLFGSKVTAVEPSELAIADGRERFPAVRFIHSLAHQLDGVQDGEVDLVLVSFVLHWVDRSRLLASLAEIDRVLCDGGNVLIADFLPATPQRVKYHHLPDKEVWTFKQDYSSILTATSLYDVVQRINVDYTTRTVREDVEPENRFAITLLRKGLYDNYRISERSGCATSAKGAA